jgi:hypothetical protein
MRPVARGPENLRYLSQPQMMPDIVDHPDSLITVIGRNPRLSVITHIRIWS